MDFVNALFAGESVSPAVNGLPRALIFIAKALFESAWRRRQVKRRREEHLNSVMVDRLSLVSEMIVPGGVENLIPPGSHSPMFLHVSPIS